MMTECEEMFNRVNKKAAAILSCIPEECQKTLDWMENYRQDIRAKLIQLQADNYNVPILPKTPSRPKHKRNKRHVLTSSDEDNITSNAERSTNMTDNSINVLGKPKRNASKLAVEKIHNQAQQNLITKMRRPAKDNTVLNDISNNAISVNIKSEKKSSSPAKDSEPKLELNPKPEDVKKENMPPPSYKPKRGRKKIKKEVESSDTENEGDRVTRSKKGVKSSASARSTRSTAKNRKDSDVILQEVPVPTIVVDSDVEETASQITSETETSKQIESTADDTTEDEMPLKSRKATKKTKKPETKSKKAKQKEANDVQENSVYEDALPLINEVAKNNKPLEVPSNDQENANRIMNCTVTLHKIVEKSNLNETRIISKDVEPKLNTKNSAVRDCTVRVEQMDISMILPSNQTVVLSPKDHWKKAEISPAVDNLITDDDDSIVKATPEKKPEPPRKGVKTKQMFSPYANSPVRKRVAAFEKLVTSELDVPVRVTRTKTRNMEKENQQSASETKIPPKSKYYTPTTNNKLPSLIPQSDSKAYRLGTMGNKINSTIQSVKSASAVKPSRAEAQLRREEDQKKRLEKEEEAKRKREAIMQAKAEEQRKKREEKQLKAQKVREEMEREKEEKLRQMIQEKEEEQQKKREWQARKMAEIEERKKAEEQAKLLKLREYEKHKMQEEKRKKQLATKPPPLPTEDCDDSDSSSDNVPRKPTYQKPQWAQSEYICRSLVIQKYIPKFRIETLFQMEASTPDLREIFESVDERLLRRNSSAVWRTPPRYSTLPKF